jgi:hypothetical protein
MRLPSRESSRKYERLKSSRSTQDTLETVRVLHLFAPAFRATLTPRLNLGSPINEDDNWKLIDYVNRAGKAQVSV